MKTNNRRNNIIYIPFTNLESIQKKESSVAEQFTNEPVWNIIPKEGATEEDAIVEAPLVIFPIVIEWIFYYIIYA